MDSYATTGTYGTPPNDCNVFVYGASGVNWYCVEGSSNVNGTYEDIESGVDVELVNDVDYFGFGSPINSVGELISAVEE